jgi:nitroreductase
MAADYDPKKTPWQINESAFPFNGSSFEQLRFLLRHAILAPSSHNTQPWKFEITDSEIRFATDQARWLKVADADQRELYISIGCALENLLVAAEHYGYGHQVAYLPDSDDTDTAAIVTLTDDGRAAEYRPSSLFEAISVRHTNHGEFDERAIPEAAKQSLLDLCTEDGLFFDLTDDAETKHRVDDLITRADAIQFSDPAWREELGYWIGRGVFGTSWLMSKVGRLAVTYVNMNKQTARKDSELLMSAPTLGVISTHRNDRVSQIQTGQVFERVALLAASMGISVHPMSQILEIPETRKEVAQLLPRDCYPQHTFRLGYAEPERHHTPRRPLEEVLLDS